MKLSQPILVACLATFAASCAKGDAGATGAPAKQATPAPAASPPTAPPGPSEAPKPTGTPAGEQLAVGDVAPAFKLPLVTGGEFDLSAATATGAVVLVFYRGHW